MHDHEVYVQFIEVIPLKDIQRIEMVQTNKLSFFMFTVFFFLRKTTNFKLWENCEMFVCRSKSLSITILFYPAVLKVDIVLKLHGPFFLFVFVCFYFSVENKRQSTATLLLTSKNKNV